MQAGDPICEPQFGITTLDSRALAAKRYSDSHGGLDKVEGYNYPGPRAWLLRDVKIEVEPCDPPLIGHGTWRVIKTRQSVDLQPGSLFLGVDEETYDCCDCSCECVLNCELVFPEFCCIGTGEQPPPGGAYSGGVCRTVHATATITYINELVPPQTSTSFDITLTWNDESDKWEGDVPAGCPAELHLSIECIGTNLFELFIEIDGFFMIFTCSMSGLICCPFLLEFFDCNLGFHFMCGGTVLLDLVLTE